MKLPMEIRSRNVDCPRAVEDWIREELWNLERFYGGILSCHVMVELPHQHRQRGNPYHVRVEITVPGGEIVVKHQPSLHRTSNAGTHRDAIRMDFADFERLARPKTGSFARVS